MTKQEIKSKIDNLKTEINILETELKSITDFTPMIAVIKGKVTIQLHPTKQKENLTRNGWRQCYLRDIEDLKKYF